MRHEPVATFTSCGPGSANLAVALAAAMMDSSAFLAITGNAPTSQFNRQPFQETGRFFKADFPSVIRPYVKRSYQPTRADMVGLAVRQAWETLTAGRPDPVNLDVPLNVFVEDASYTAPPPATRTQRGTPGAPQALSDALDLLLKAEHPARSAPAAGSCRPCPPPEPNFLAASPRAASPSESGRTQNETPHPSRRRRVPALLGSAR